MANALTMGKMGQNDITKKSCSGNDTINSINEMLMSFKHE